MKIVYKYPLYIGKSIGLTLPLGAKILCVAMQDQALCLWAEVNDSAPFTQRTFSVFGTGHVMPDNFPLTYIGTVFDGPFVWHVYEQT